MTPSITLQLDQETYEALRLLAADQYRHYKRQAIVLIRQGLIEAGYLQTTEIKDSEAKAENG